MRLIGVRAAQQQLGGLVERSQRERVVLTRHGKPVALLTGIEGQDLEEVLLSRDVGLARLVADRRAGDRPLVSHDRLVAATRRDLARKRRSRA